MKLSIINLFLVLGATALSMLVCGCGGPSADDVAGRINNGAALGADDFECMIRYNEEACDSLAARYRRTVTMADIDRATLETEKDFPHHRIFAQTLLLNYSRLSSGQTESIARMQQKINNAFPNR